MVIVMSNKSANKSANKSDTKWTVQKIREEFVKYFESSKHKYFASASLIPQDDPTLLFVNAGMVPFKSRFLGQLDDGVKTAVSVQKCVRAGGKHNDLEQVGYTARHHTFFEMLGNFSFGDYFKQEAIEFAWNFLTQILKINPNKLWVSVFNKDQQAKKIWLEKIGIDKDRISLIGEKDNFWSMGSTGPCGPCTEIFYDHGADVAGGPPGSPEEDGDRYVEIWNLVFMQYDRQEDGQLKPLPAPSVDTGMGLERIAAAMQGVHSNYEIDLFTYLLNHIASILDLSQSQINQAATKHSMQAIADHIRSCAFMILDGVEPSNEGRGYVLRRIIRRALRHAHHLGCDIGAGDTFFSQLVKPLSEIMGQAYPQLISKQQQVIEILYQEEIQFAKTLAAGLKHLEQSLSKIPENTHQLSGEVVFKLYDTYGFPVDLTADLLRSKSITIDYAGFDQAMEQQKSRAREHAKFNKVSLNPTSKSSFIGYQDLSVIDSANKITEVYAVDHNTGNVLSDKIDLLSVGKAGVVILEKTPFYAESGGQVGDIGEIKTDSGVFIVKDTQKIQAAILHFGKVKSGQVNISQAAKASVDISNRQDIMRHHSATHLLHAALRLILGNQVTQKGSLVNADKLRFDFSYNKAISHKQLLEIELLVNQHILKAQDLEIIETSVEKAKEMGAMALFGEKYGDKVRVLKMGDFSIELCGGTHVQNTADCGLFKVIASSSIASGVRRIEAICGFKALKYVQQLQDQQLGLCGVLKCSPSELLVKCEVIVKKQKKLEKQLNNPCMQHSSPASNIDNILKQVKQVGPAQLLVFNMPGEVDSNAMRSLNDQLKKSLGANGFIVLASKGSDRVKILVSVGDALTARIRANDFVNKLAVDLGGKGGGRADMAQAGGDKPENLAKVLATVEDLVSHSLKKQ